MASETWALWLRGVSVVDQLKCHLGARGQLVTWGNLQEPFPNFFTTRVGRCVSLVITSRPVAAVPSVFPDRIAIVRSSSSYLSMSGCLTSRDHGEATMHIS